MITDKLLTMMVKGNEVDDKGNFIINKKTAFIEIWNIMRYYWKSVATESAFQVEVLDQNLL